MSPIPQAVILTFETEGRRGLASRLREAGVRVSLIASPLGLEGVVDRCGAALVFFDLAAGERSGTQLRELAVSRPGVRLVVLLPEGFSGEDVGRGYQLGASDCLPEQAGTEEILLCLEKAARAGVPGAGRVGAAVFVGGSGITGRSAVMQEVRRQIAQVAKTAAPVLVTGETGTGKELVARCIHRLSGVPGPMVCVNCTTLPETLVESELFGHERGAFTGAVERRVGRFEAAQGGSLFLDEIGEIDLRLQSKLLRVLQEKEFERVGGSGALRTSARFIAATNRDLEAAVQRGEFRRDLYHRLNVFPIELPPLRRRPDDIPLLAEHFLPTLARDNGLPRPKLTAGALRALREKHWGGNVRELRNTLERAVIATGGRRPLQAEDFAAPSTGSGLPAAVTSLGAASAPAASRPGAGASLWWEGRAFPTLRELERTHIEEALRRAAGHRRTAAAMLGISLRTLQNRLRDYRAAG